VPDLTPEPTPFDLARQQFLAALRVMLADPARTPQERQAEGWATVAAVSREMVLSDLQEKT